MSYATTWSESQSHASGVRARPVHFCARPRLFNYLGSFSATGGSIAGDDGRGRRITLLHCITLVQCYIISPIRVHCWDLGGLLTRSGQALRARSGGPKDGYVSSALTDRQDELSGLESSPERSWTS